MRFLRLCCVVLCAALVAPPRAQAQEGFSALARLLPEGSSLTAAGDEVALVLALSQAVPYRLRLVSGPPRLAVDFAEVDFAALPAADPGAVLGRADAVTGLRHGLAQPGWTRLVVELAGPHVVTSAGMTTDDATGRAVVRIALAPASAADFAAAASPGDALFAGLPGPGQAAGPPLRAPGAPRVVVLDPGHGGIDPGAERDGHREADLMLAFARELREALRRAGGFEVVLTRNDDIFVSLEGRIRVARDAGADMFLSLHADALPDGGATGATVYTFAAEASAAAAAALAERHDRADLLAGVDLSAQDDLIAGVLMSIARTETAPRSDALAGRIVEAMRARDLRMHRRPRQAGGFSVLKAPDIPSVLIELGFMSAPRDLGHLLDLDWRTQMAEALVAALQGWAADEDARADLLRR
jgi:N-acetylmuramoyl-L-alanine amidase